MDDLLELACEGWLSNFDEEMVYGDLAEFCDEYEIPLDYTFDFEIVFTVTCLMENKIIHFITN